MTKVSAYQTDDGKIFTSEKEAAQWDFVLALRGALQSDDSFPKSPNCSVNDAVLAIARNKDSIADIIRRFNQKMRGLESRLIS